MVSLWTQAHSPSFAGGRDPSSTGQIPSIMGQSIRGEYTEMPVSVHFNNMASNHWRRRSHIMELFSSERIGEGLLHCPWMDEGEWMAVTSWLYGSTPSERRRGSERVSVWRARGTVPFFVKFTADIVDCLLLKEEFTSSTGSAQRVSKDSVCLSFAMLITRFINGVFDYGRWYGDHRFPIHQVVKNLGIPVWLVSLRHDSTHRVLPSLPLLSNGLLFAYKWLWINYWHPQYTSLSNNEVSLAASLPLPSQQFEITLTPVQFDSLEAGLREYIDIVKTGSFNRRRHLPVVKKILKQLEKSDKDVYIKIMKDRLFLLPLSENPIVSLNDDFPVLSSWTVNEWKHLLSHLGQSCSTAKTIITESLIKLVHTEEVPDQLLVLLGWLGLLLDEQSSSVVLDETGQSSFVEVDLTGESSLMSGALDIMKLLMTSKDNPGPFTLTINERLLKNVSSDSSHVILQFSSLLSASESICPSLPPLPLLSTESRYKRKLEKLEEELTKKRRRRSRSSETKNEGKREEEEGEREGKEEEEDAVWKKATGYNWCNCPLGCVPGQTLSPVVFDLPDHVFNDNVTLRDGEERDVGSKGGDGEGESVIEMDMSITQEEDITVSTDREIRFEDNAILINKTLTTEQIKYLKETITLY